jgi:hypothetical protein
MSSFTAVQKGPLNRRVTFQPSILLFLPAENTVCSGDLGYTFVVFEQGLRIQIFILHIHQLLYSNSSVRNPQIDIRNPQIDSTRSIRNPQTDLP